MGSASPRGRTPRRIWSLDTLGALGRGQTHLTVTFTDGTALESSQFAARSVLQPLTNDEIVAKYQALTTPLLTPRRRTCIEELVLGLDDLPNLTTLIDELAAPVPAAFDQ